jgi:hypothetical protein
VTSILPDKHWLEAMVVGSLVEPSSDLVSWLRERTVLIGLLTVNLSEIGNEVVSA